MRSFKLFFGLVERFHESTGTEKPTPPRKRKAPNWSGKGYHAQSTEDHNHLIYFKALDYTISSIKNRFDQPGFQVYKNLEELLVRTANMQDYIPLN